MKWAVLCLSVLACSEPRAPVAPRPGPGLHTASTEAPIDRWAVVELATLPGTVALYDPASWQKKSHGSFTALEHHASRSTLVLRVWRAARLVRPSECEAEARLARPNLPRMDPESIIDSRPLEAPNDFSGSLLVAAEPMPNGSTHGAALAIGAAIGRCFVLAFETTAGGTDAASVVGDRLRVAADRIVPSVELRGVDERVEPDRELK